MINLPRRVAVGLVVLAAGLPLVSAPGHAQGSVPPGQWRQDGPFGAYDLAAAQRGYAVFAGQCASCHALGDVTWHDLGGLGLDNQAIHDLAAAHPGAAIDDPLPAPYPDASAARKANGGVLPPDLSRYAAGAGANAAGGAGFIEAFLTGYHPAPAGASVPAGMYYNSALPDHATAMAPALKDGAVQYADGVKPTVARMARDVSTFLAWTADPHVQDRHRMGVRVVIYLALLSFLLLLLNRRVWAQVRD